MTKKPFNLDNQELVVDWISFKFQNLDLNTKSQIVDYLFNLGFNSYYRINQLNTRDISETFVIYEILNIDRLLN